MDFRRWAVVGAFWVLGCAGGDGTATDPTAEAGDVPAGDDLGVVDALPDYAGREFEVCVPGTASQCTGDGLGLVVCNAEGTGYTTRTCGPDGVCRAEPLGCTTCIPGRRKCQDEEIVLRCDGDTDSWAVAENCDPGETGRVCELGMCVSLCELAEKLSSYIGCEYWAVDLDNAFVPSGGQGGYHDAAGAQYAIVVSNTSTKYPVTVEIDNVLGPALFDSAGNPFPVEPIPPMGLRIFNLPRTYEAPASGGGTQTTYMEAEGTMIAPVAYRIQSSLPITAYQFNPLDNVGVFSNDASILLPTNALGRYHVVMTREQTFTDLKGYLTVIGTFNGQTEVVVKVTAPTLAGPDIPAMNPGETRSFLLGRYDVLNLETNAFGADLTGSIVTASRPVAVFGGSEAANAPNTTHCCPGGQCEGTSQWMECLDRDDCLCEWPKNVAGEAKDVKCRHNYDCILYNTCCADHLEMQMFPVKTWGTKYVATQSFPRGGEQDVWRIVAAENQTRVTTYPLNMLGVVVLDQGEWVDFEAAGHFEIHATKPVMVGQFLAAQDAPDPNINFKGPNDASTGDPSFILGVPVEQFRKEYVFLAPDKYMFDCVNIIAPVGVPVYLDGKELKQESLTFRPIREILADIRETEGISDPYQLGKNFGDYHVIGSGEWAVWRLIIRDGVHTARSDEPFGVISYGYDQYVSYGYPAGLNLEDLKLVGDVP